MARQNGLYRIARATAAWALSIGAIAIPRQSAANCGPTLDFNAPNDLADGQLPAAVIVHRMNWASWTPDVLVANTGDSTVNIFPHGGQNFTSFWADTPVALAVGDFNGDRCQDFATVGQDSYVTAYVQVEDQNKNCTGRYAIWSISIIVGATPVGMVSADFVEMVMMISPLLTATAQTSRSSHPTGNSSLSRFFTPSEERAQRRSAS